MTWRDRILESPILVDRGIDPVELLDAMWAGDVNRLDEIAPCGCCCHDHTFEDCPARLWEACRGQCTPTRAELASWARFYAETRGMSDRTFYAWDLDAGS